MSAPKAQRSRIRLRLKSFTSGQSQGSPVVIPFSGGTGRRAAGDHRGGPSFAGARNGTGSGTFTAAVNSEMIQSFIPIVSVLAVFGFPVAIVFVIKYFKLKDRELALEAETREHSQRQQLAIEQRVERLEEVLISLDHDVRARLGIEHPTNPLPARPDLLEAPAGAASQQGGEAGPQRTKVR